MKNWLEPHFRLIYLVIFGLIISTLQAVNFLLFLTALCGAIVAWLYRIQAKKQLFRWLKFNGFSLLLFLTLSWKIGTNGIEIYPQGIELAQQISLRMNLILLTTWGLLYQVSDTILVQAIAKLPLPSKFIQLTILTVRYITLLGELNQKMDIAMKARGFKPRLNWRTLEIYAQRVALLIIHAMIKAEQAEMALKARGFKFGQHKHTRG